MRFWDSSAVVPLLVRQESSRVAEIWIAEDPDLVLWTLTSVEVVSAFRRLVREAALEEDSARIAERRLDQLVRTCHVVVDVPAVKRQAIRVLRFHQSSERSTRSSSELLSFGRRVIRKGGHFTPWTYASAAPPRERASAFPAGRAP